MCSTSPMQKEVSGSSGKKEDGQDVRRLLVPVRNAREVFHGARYARNLADTGIPVKVCLLHIVDTLRGPADLLHAANASGEEDAGAQALLVEAAALLDEFRLQYDSHVRQGDVVFSIFDSAELFDCHEIVLPGLKPQIFPRLFSESTARKLLRSRRSVPVIMVDADGVVCGASDGRIHTPIHARIDRSGLAAG